MLTSEQRSNIAQWVSEFPRYSHVITDPTMLCFFSKEPPPNDTTEVSHDLWDSLTEQMAGLEHG
jgi:hypothetical protein